MTLHLGQVSPLRINQLKYPYFYSSVFGNNIITFALMQNKYVHIFFMLLSYAIALGHDVIPHHHVEDAEQLGHHHHHDPIMNEKCNLNLLTVESGHSEGHHHTFCHYSSAGDSTSLAGNDVGIKVPVKKMAVLTTPYVGCDSTAFLRKHIVEANYRPPHYADSSSHLLSSGLRAPPALS